MAWPFSWIYDTWFAKSVRTPASWHQELSCLGNVAEDKKVNGSMDVGLEEVSWSQKCKQLTSK